MTEGRVFYVVLIVANTAAKTMHNAYRTYMSEYFEINRSPCGLVCEHEIVFSL